MLKSRCYLEEATKVFKALANSGRLLMLDGLRSGERCVQDLQVITGEDISTISRHLTQLKNAGLVGSRKDGSKVFYFLLGKDFDLFLDAVHETVGRAYRAKTAEHPFSD